MKKFNFSILICALFLMLISFSATKAQDEEQTNDANAPKQNLNQTNRPSLLAELDLTPEQIQQIRRINRENQPLLRAAQQRLREARTNLDQAVYDDNSDEREVQTRLKNVQQAQAEVARLRSSAEFAVRKVLTPEQLLKFREVRRRFAEQRQLENRPARQRNRRMNAPNRKLVNRPRRLRNNKN